MPTILHRLARWADEQPEAPAQRYKEQAAWKSITTRELRDRVLHLALFLESKGVTAADISCILAGNCPQWVHLDLAAQLLGAKSTGIYPNSTAKDIAYILAHTDAKVLAVQNADFYRRATSEPNGAAAAAKLSLLMTFDNDASFASGLITYQAALAEGKKLAESSGVQIKKYLDKIDPKSAAFIIYTSGTTGNPKGALLSHDNLAFTSDMVTRTWQLPLEGQQDLFSFLPLCHIAEKLHSLGVGISNRYTVNFCSKFDNVSVELPEIQPTLMLSVPRIWEKMMEGVLNKLKRAPEFKRKMAHWALGVGARTAAAKFAGRMASPVDLIQLPIAEKLVLSKVREALGLGRATLLASGAAALPSPVSIWFRSLRLEIVDTLGQTESTGIICMSHRGVDSAGTVGKPAPEIEVKIAEDGEILCRGRNVFIGYHKDDANTAATLEGGWLHSGDLGELTDKGLIRVRGRKKEILKTSGGKMVAPLPIEEELKAACPSISQVCMVGDGRKYLSCLITLNEAALSQVKARSGEPSKNVIDEPEVNREIKKALDELNRKLASYEQIKRFAILSREFSIADGEMTPTLKMKRNVVEARYKDVILGFYPGES